MIKRYVKGARNVKGFFAVESTLSSTIAVAGLRAAFRGGVLGWLPAGVESAQVDSLDSSEESTWAKGRSAKFLITIPISGPIHQGGFQVDSPVRNPDASEMPRSAPPYTNLAREEPCRGDHAMSG